MSVSGHSMDRERGVSVAEYGVTPLSHPAFFDSKGNLFVSLQSILGRIQISVRVDFVYECRKLLCDYLQIHLNFPAGQTYTCSSY